MTRKTIFELDWERSDSMPQVHGLKVNGTTMVCFYLGGGWGKGSNTTLFYCCHRLFSPGVRPKRLFPQPEWLNDPLY